jgi:hypothetical protein
LSGIPYPGIRRSPRCCTPWGWPANEAKCVGRRTRPTRGFAYAWPATHIGYSLVGRIATARSCGLVPALGGLTS